MAEPWHIRLSPGSGRHRAGVSGFERQRQWTQEQRSQGRRSGWGPRRQGRRDRACGVEGNGRRVGVGRSQGPSPPDKQRQFSTWVGERPRGKEARVGGRLCPGLGGQGDSGAHVACVPRQVKVELSSAYLTEKTREGQQSEGREASPTFTEQL